PFSSSENMTARVISKAQKNGLLLYPSQAGTDGVEGDGIIISPPFTITDRQLDEAVELLSKTLYEVQNEKQGNEVK
ncbi:MAG: aspartate aminotransferase family protein, partial [Priestia megaterium]